MRTTQPLAFRTSFRSLSAPRRAIVSSTLGLLVSLVLLVVHIFVPIELLQIVSLWFFGAAFVGLWIAVLTWRMPVLGRGRLIALTGLWAGGIGVSVGLVLTAASSRQSLLWVRSVQWVALAVSFVVGALLLRGLLRRRASLIVGRLLSLISPLAILLLIILLPLEA